MTEDLDSTEVADELDSTKDLLAEDLDSTDVLLAYPDSYYQDSEEDEVFFGSNPSPIKAKLSSVCTRRQTITEDEFNKIRRSQAALSSMPLLSADNSIPEECEDWQALQEAQETETVSEKPPEGEETSNQSIEEEELVISRRQESNQSLNVTERRRGRSSSKKSHIIPILDGELSTPIRNSDWEADVEDTPVDKHCSISKEQVSANCSLVLPTASLTHSGIYDSFSDDTQEVVVQDEDEIEEYIKDIQHIEAVEGDDDDDQTVCTETDLSQDLSQNVTEKEEEDETKLSKYRTVKEDEEELWEVRSPISNKQDESVFSRRSLEALSASTASFINEDEDNLEILHDDPAEVPQVILSRPSLEACSYHTANISLGREPDFDTTMQEMMLYEMFGENYDELVEAMTREEKVELQAKLAEKLAGEDEEELQQRLARIGGRRSRSIYSSVSSRDSPYSLPSLPATPRHHSGGDSPAASPKLRDDLESDTSIVSSSSSPGLVVKDPQHKMTSGTETSAGTYLLPTVSSRQRRVSPSPSLKKSPENRPLWVPPSPIPGRELSKSPLKPIHKIKSATRIPQPGFLTPARPEFLTPARPHPHRTPLQSLKVTARMPPAESPVAGYLRNNPAPPLVRNVAAKETCKDLESTMVEVVTNQENLLPSNLPYCPLPANTYTKAGRLAEEVEIDNLAGPAFSYIPDAYGQVINSEAKVTKHLGRRKVDEDCQLPTNVEDSLQSAASLEMSILETKVVRKFALPRN